MALAPHNVSTRGTVPLIGQLGISGLTLYSDWQWRKANRAVFLCEAIGRSTDAVLDISVEHKGRNDLDSSATVAGAFDLIDGTGVTTKDVTGIKELWRYKLEFGDAFGAGLTDWTWMRMLDPVWVPN